MGMGGLIFVNNELSRCSERAVLGGSKLGFCLLGEGFEGKLSVEVENAGESGSVGGVAESECIEWRLKLLGFRVCARSWVGVGCGVVGGLYPWLLLIASLLFSWWIDWSKSKSC